MQPGIVLRLYRGILRAVASSLEVVRSDNNCYAAHYRKGSCLNDICFGGLYIYSQTSQ